MQGIFKEISQKGYQVNIPYCQFCRNIALNPKGDAAFFCLTRIDRKDTIYRPVYGIPPYRCFRNLDTVFPDICKDGGSIASFCILCYRFKMMPDIMPKPAVFLLSLC